MCGHVESSDGRDIKVEVRAKKWGGQIRSQNGHVIKLIGQGINRQTHSTKYFKISSMFFMILFTSVEAEVVGKSLNCGSGYWLKNPIKYHFHGQEKIVQWLTKN